jgi:mRNA-degrading endonuclease RelE of RelBE toxin-antitoxin system
MRRVRAGIPANREYDYRLRVGNYRVIFNWDGEIKVVEIEGVKKRDELMY